MQEPTLAHNEAARMAALCSTGQLDTPIEGRFEIITRLARRVMDVPIAAVSLVDADRQWFKSINGLDVAETGRDISFCGHTILTDKVMIIPDARKDPRFSDNPLVTGPPNIVFYVGYPLSSEIGDNIATLCLIDTKPRNPADKELAAIQDLAAMAEQQLNATTQKSVATELLSRLSRDQRNELIDPLTRLWNRKGIDSILTRQKAKAHEQEQGITLLAVRIDGPSNQPEQETRSILDSVLCESAKSLLVGIRQWDNVGRYGDNVFIVIIGEDANSQYAIESAKRLRTQINARPIKTDVGELHAHATLGVTYAPAGFRSSNEELFDLALAALRQADSRGQDGIFIDTSNVAA